MPERTGEGAEPCSAVAVDDEARHDLREIGANPDYWYPAAWSDGKNWKIGKTLAREFAGEPIVLYRGKSGKSLRDGGPLRPPAGAAASGRRRRRDRSSAAIMAGPTIASAAASMFPRSGGHGASPNGVRGYPCREIDGPIFIFSGRPLPLADQRARPPALGDRWTAPTRPGASTARSPLTTNFMHENLMDMNDEFLHRKPDGKDQGALPGPPQRRGLGRRSIIPSAGRKASARWARSRFWARSGRTAAATIKT